MNLPKVKTAKLKRLGRGYGSGKGGHTSSHGQKGQKSRGAKLHILFEGYKTKKSFYKRLPFLRGKAKNKGSLKPIAINVSDLEVFAKNGKVTLQSVAATLKLNTKLIAKRGIKVLGSGKLTKPLEVSLPVSAKAKAKIEKVKGKVVG